MKTSHIERTVFFALPAGTLLASFAGICVMTGTAWPWNRVVHEDGLRTLLGTLFYFEHATRELVPDILLAVAVAGAVRYFFPPDAAIAAAQMTRWRRRFAVLSAATLTTIVGGTLWLLPGQAILDNLSQLHTRVGAPLVWGAHWRYHLIERLAQILAAFSLSGIVWILRGRPDFGEMRGRFRVFSGALVLFGALTLLFGVTAEPFRDPAFLGHQLRELFTHGLVTLPLALGVCLELSRKFSRPKGSLSQRNVWPIVLTGGIAVLLGAFLLAASVLSDSQAHGQTTGLAALVFPHFAEHGLGYLLVPALAGLCYLWPVKAGSVLNDVILE